MARPPIIPFDTTHGAGEWDAIRTTKAGCGVGEPPCQHFGFDAVGEPGTIVAAPSSGWVLVSQRVTGYPFEGYGPAVVLLAHDDRGGDHGFVSTRYTLLGHLDASTLRFDLPFKQAAKMLEAAAAAPTFTDAGRPLAGGAAATSGWAKLADGTVARVGDVAFGGEVGWPSWAPYVKEGEQLGSLESTMRHTHWEVRIAPLAQSKVTRPDGQVTFGRIDPVGWLDASDPTHDWIRTAAPSKLHPRGARGGIGGLVLIGLGLWSMLSDD